MNIICLADGLFCNVTDDVVVNEVIFFDAKDDDIYTIMHHYCNDENDKYVKNLEIANSKICDGEYRSAYLNSIQNIIKNRSLSQFVEINLKTSDEKKPLITFVKCVCVL